MDAMTQFEFLSLKKEAITLDYRQIFGVVEEFAQMKLNRHSVAVKLGIGEHLYAELLAEFIATRDVNVLNENQSGMSVVEHNAVKAFVDGETFVKAFTPREDGEILNAAILPA